MHSLSQASHTTIKKPFPTFQFSPHHKHTEISYGDQADAKNCGCGLSEDWPCSSNYLAPCLSSSFRNPLHSSQILQAEPCIQLLSHGLLFAILWTVAHQALLSIGFSQQEYGSGLPFPSPCLSHRSLYYRNIKIWTDFNHSNEPEQ